ncbi:dethiobiotin synthase [Pedobacter cryophilus]|uniref:ATP-dependent dethiobiotin synthetase BioD n=1 Tax=Pedobacter cryophilus TaxID=2571271 RepID=A0A4U1C3Q8_9SPHI|nr:dethiobiotin synthase [Pedobacter cryophilus]TKB97844.1 dethiobiotin synthase [Pedobacter cryophilus]
MSKKYFVTGIGTEIGKTIVSAVLVEKLNADYWKPIQSGELDNSDTHKVKSLISNEVSVFHPEAYQLTQPYSPHHSAALDGLSISLNQINLPKTNNALIIEGAGGLMVPLNAKDLMIDLIVKLSAEVILVSKNYLGSINHTLLSIEALKNRGIAIKGLIFNGVENKSSEEIIINISGLTVLGRIPEFSKIDQTSIKEATSAIQL